MRLTTVRNKSFVNLTDATGYRFDHSEQSGILKALYRNISQFKINLGSDSMFDSGVLSGKLKALPPL